MSGLDTEMAHYAEDELAAKLLRAIAERRCEDVRACAFVLAERLEDDSVDRWYA